MGSVSVSANMDGDGLLVSVANNVAFTNISGLINFGYIGCSFKEPGLQSIADGF